MEGRGTFFQRDKPVFETTPTQDLFTRLFNGMTRRAETAGFSIRTGLTPVVDVAMIGFHIKYGTK